MADPASLSLATIGGAALTEGIKFLYGQAGELLKARRERQRARAGEAGEPPSTEPHLVNVTIPSSLEGGSYTALVRDDRIESAENEIRDLRRALTDYVEGIEHVDPANGELLLRVDALRRLLELIYERPLTFAGEVRSTGATVIDSSVDVGSVAGYIAAVRADALAGGDITSRVRAERVDAGGQAIGVDVGRIEH